MRQTLLPLNAVLTAVSASLGFVALVGGSACSSSSARGASGAPDGGAPGDASIDQAGDVGRVICPPAYADCDGNPANGCETDTTSSHDHCGSCAHACASDLVCYESACGTSCGPLTAFAAGTTSPGSHWYRLR